MKKILVINPGSTSTKLAYFEDTNRIIDETINHDKEMISKFNKVADQLEYRLEIINNWLKTNNIKLDELDAIASRGGQLRPIEGGSYRISEKMVQSLLAAEHGEHASNLGAAMALQLAGTNKKIMCLISDPTCTDEMNE